jgi:mRNA-degrading endonuclease toxin of MazEF toxin-antitoxin module
VQNALQRRGVQLADPGPCFLSHALTEGPDMSWDNMPPQVKQGQFWWVDDKVIAFPEDRDREPHTSRGCIIVEGDASLNRGGVRVLVVPTSSQTDRKDIFDVVIPHPPAPTYACVALVEHVQPILRADLTNLVGPLPEEWADKVLGGVLLALGVEAQPEEEDTPEDSDVPF